MLRAVIADDEEIVRTVMADRIPWKELGISLAATAADGEEALDAVRRLRPDIVITDIRMPRMDGLELIKRCVSEGCDAEFVILSGFGEFSYAQRAMLYGVRHYLLKPSRKEELISVLKEIRDEREGKSVSGINSDAHFTEDADGLSRRYREALEGKADASLVDDMERIFRSLPLPDAEALFVRMAMDSISGEQLFRGMRDVKDADDLLLLARSFIEHRMPGTGSAFPVRTMKEYIDANFSDPGLSLKWISENVVYMNPEHLSKLFQKETGQRFSDYLNSERIREAQRLMDVYHESTVGDIAEKVGYSNPGYFFHVFRRYTGMTPGEYMRQRRAASDD